jgi:hypothetical protein
MDHAIVALNGELVSLLNMAGGTLCRALRPPVGSSSGSVARQVRVGTSAARARATVAAAMSADGAKGGASGNGGSPFGPFPKGMEIAEGIEQKARGMRLETSVTPEQEARIDHVTANAQDLYLALRAARYVWQVCVVLNDDPQGRMLFARLKPVTQCVVEMNGRVAAALEGQHGSSEAAAAVAGQYRNFLEMRAEVARSVHGEHSPVSRMTRAALLSLTVCAENMTRVAARYTLPAGARRPGNPRGVPPPPDINDGILQPLPKW